MISKYFIVTHEIVPHCLIASALRPGMGVNQGEPSLLDQQIADIIVDAENLCGVRPVFVNFSQFTRTYFSGDQKPAKFIWCLFDEGAALAFSLLVSGTITTKEWPEPIDPAMTEEDILVKFFEVVVAGQW